MSEHPLQPRLQVPQALLHSMRAHAKGAYPEECCGVMIGSHDATTETTVVHAIEAAANEREDEARHHRYLIPPETILKAERAARDQGHAVVGYYHSHPDHPAIPSDFDREHAWPTTSYLIVSVREGEAREHRSWRLSDDRETFGEEAVDVTRP